MSRLAADVGNAHTALGLLEGDEVLAHWRVGTGTGRTADEWAVLLRGLLGERVHDVDGLVWCAAVPGVMREWRDMVSRHFPGVAHVVVEPGVRTGLPVLTDNPREVGADRVVNALAAARLLGGPVVVVALGATATTFDVVDGSGRYVGGAIAPGIEVAHAALGRDAAQLREVEILRPRHAIARNTVEAVQSGLVLGVAAQVEGLVARMVAELDAGPVRVVATGAWAPLVAPECACFTDHVAHLTLRGLALVFARHPRGQ